MVVANPLIPIHDILAAADRIGDLSPPTPLMRSDYFSRKLGANIFFKLEVLNPTHSFKTRGASNAILSLSESQRSRGVITASGGNHGLGVAYVAEQLGIPARIYLPENTPRSKVEALESFQVKIALKGASWDDSNRCAIATAKRHGMNYIHPFDDPAVMAGQATIGLEISQQLDNVEAVVASIGGGGLIAGVISALGSRSPATRVYGAETMGADSMAQSYRQGELTTLPAITSIANTLGARRPGTRHFEIVRRHAGNVVAVTDSQAVETLLEILEHEKLLVEPAMSCSLAAIISGQIPLPPSGNIVVIVCGGNTSLSEIERWQTQFGL